MCLLYIDIQCTHLLRSIYFDLHHLLFPREGKTIELIRVQLDNNNSVVCTIFARLSAWCGCKLGNFSEVGVLANFRFTASLNDCLSERDGRYCTFALSLFNLLRRSQLVKRSLIGQKYDHAANMNSESAKELLKWRFSALVCTLGKRKGM